MIVFKFKYLLFVTALLSAFGGSAQIMDGDSLGKSALKKHARHAESYGDIYTAIQFYATYAKKKPENARVQFRLAELYEKNRNYDNAAAAYLKAYELDKNPEALYRHIKMLKMTGDVSTAKKKYTEFNRLVETNNYPEAWKNIIKTEIISCDTALALLADSMDILISNAGPQVNGPHAEFSPIPYSEETLLYGAIKETEIRYYTPDSLPGKRRMYLSDKIDDAYLDSDIWDVPFNNGEADLANGTFNLDRSAFIFTHCTDNRKNKPDCKLWISRKSNGKWMPAEKLPEEINISGYTATQPALVHLPENNIEQLYFVSNRPGGEGGLDIWKTSYNKNDSTWTTPINAGNTINGAADEMTPYFSPEEQKLYFSSASHPGMGGLDIYSVRTDVLTYSAPENAGYPINSTADDLFYVRNISGDGGYFVSNRKGGYQMLNETCCDDIYEFENREEIILAIQGFVIKVYEDEYMTGDGDNLSFESFSTNFLDNVFVELYQIDDGKEVLLENMTTISDGLYFMDLLPKKQYRLKFSKEGYYSNQIEVDTRSITKSDTIHQDVGLSEMTGRAIVINNIHYEFDSSKLTEDAKKKIKNGILNALLENPLIIAELSSHTDSKGGLEYNQILSQERAESVIRYLIANGIEAERLKAKGYGELVPIAPNKHEDGSDNPEGRALNRRTEFKVIGELDVEIKQGDQ